MKQTAITLFLTLIIFSCQEKKSKETTVAKEVEFNQELVDELEEIRKIDQLAADIARGENENLSEKEWESKRDSLHKANQKRIKEIFADHGFVGHDLAGERGSQNFWLVVQHADNDPEFQKEVLKDMELEVEKGNADSKSYGSLVDRLRLNNGEKQLYGTQVDYNWEICQAFPKNLQDSSGVNERRMEIGLEPLEVYLNNMSQSHYKMNEAIFKKMGLTGPALYKTK